MLSLEDPQPSPFAEGNSELGRAVFSVGSDLPDDKDSTCSALMADTDSGSSGW